MRCEFYALQKWNVHNPFCGNCLGSIFFVFDRTRRLGDFGLDRATVEGMDVDEEIPTVTAYDSREGRAALLIAGARDLPEREGRVRREESPPRAPGRGVPGRGLGL